MGHEIVYCSGCATQLREPDFGKARAIRQPDGRPWCAACAREHGIALGAGSDAPPNSSSLPSEPTGRNNACSSRTVRPAVRGTSAGWKVPAAVIAAVLGAVLIWALLHGNDPAVIPEPKEGRPTPSRSTASEPPKESSVAGTPAAGKPAPAGSLDQELARL